MSGFQSSLAPIAPACREPCDANARKAARDAWHKHGIVLVNPAWLQSWTDQKQAELLAEKLFGQRKGAK